MSNDRMSNTTDVRWRHTGTGHHVSFQCARCTLPKGALGRRLQLVKGLRQWVCKGCVK